VKSAVDGAVAVDNRAATCRRGDLLGIDARLRRVSSPWSPLAAGALPAELCGPGVIVRRQTTYWDIQTAAGQGHRLHFRDRYEKGFVEASYPSVELLDQHPLLARHTSAEDGSVFVSGRAAAPSALVAELERALRDRSAGWRGLADHDASRVSAGRVLTAGYGLLLRGPLASCDLAVATLARAGVDASTVASRSRPADVRVLLLGRSFVIAGGFRHERPA
jgi:hypothetical protein